MADVSFDFTDRVAVVSGAAQGIGQAIAARLATAGALVVAVDHDADRLAEAWAGDDTVLPVPLDVTDPEACRLAVEAAVDRAGRLDVVVNNAGITRDAVVWKLTDEAWRAVLDVHLGGTFHLTRAAIPHMRQRGYGRIVNITSYTGLHGNVGQANYAAAKAGIVGFTKTVAKEVARFGITVNAVSPNAATSMVTGVPPDKLAELTAAIPQGRFADPAEIAGVVAFLATREAGYVTGAVVPVDGGMSM